MVSFESFQYRKDLAKEIKEIKREQNQDKQRKILKQAQETKEYQTAKTETIVARRQKIEEQQAIEGQGEKLRSGRSKKTILSGAEAFAGEILEKYPQVNEDGKLNYYLSGSLGIMLLLKSGKFEILDQSCIPEIVPIGEKQIPSEALKYFEGCVRKIGDHDFVPLEEWEKSDARTKKGVHYK